MGDILTFYFIPTVQFGKIRSSGLGQGSARTSRMETSQLYLVACRCYSPACKHVELGLHWDPPRTAIWFRYVMFSPVD